MSNVRGVSAALLFVSLAACAVGVAAGVEAQTAAASSAGPVLGEDDLPSKYDFDSGTTDSVSPTYPTVDSSCVVNPDNKFSGLLPNSHFVSFSTDKTGITGGSEIVHVFSDVTEAKALYRDFAKTYAAMTKCAAAKRAVPASGGGTRIVQIGKWSRVTIPSVGDERIAVALEPAVPGNRSRVAVLREGTSVVVLNLRDDDQSKAMFDKLVRTAEKRAAAT